MYFLTPHEYVFPFARLLVRREFVDYITELEVDDSIAYTGYKRFSEGEDLKIPQREVFSVQFPKWIEASVEPTELW